MPLIVRAVTLLLGLGVPLGAHDDAAGAVGHELREDLEVTYININ